MSSVLSIVRSPTGSHSLSLDGRPLELASPFNYPPDIQLHHVYKGEDLEQFMALELREAKIGNKVHVFNVRDNKVVHLSIFIHESEKFKIMYPCSVEYAALTPQDRVATVVYGGRTRFFTVPGEGARAPSVFVSDIEGFVSFNYNYFRQIMFLNAPRFADNPGDRAHEAIKTLQVGKHNRTLFYEACDEPLALAIQGFYHSIQTGEDMEYTEGVRVRLVDFLVKERVKVTNAQLDQFSEGSEMNKTLLMLYAATA